MNFLTDIFGAVCDSSWRASCLIVLFLAIRPLVRGRIAARIVFWAWVAVAIRLLLPFSFPASWSPFASPVHLSQLRFTEIPGGPVVAAAGSFVPAEPRSGNLAAASEAGVGLPRLATGSSSISFWAGAVWIAGVTLLAGMRVGMARSFRRRLRRTAVPPDPQLKALVVSVSQELGIREPGTSATNLVAAPAVQGLFRPRLLFPPRFADQLAPAEMRFVVAHELGHCHHRDVAAHALIHAAQVLHWFNPLVWLAARAAKTDCEEACDEFALSRLGIAHRSAYGATLLKVLGTLHGANPVPGALAIIDSNRHIKRRIQMIIAFRPATAARTLISITALALVIALGMTRRTMATEPAAPANPVVTTTAPQGWWKNGSKVAAYVVGVDRAQTHGGRPSAYVKSIEPKVDGFGGMMQVCSADNYHGKRLRFSAWVKTENANDGGAHLWFRIDGQDKDQTLQFDNMDKRPVQGTTDWQQYSIVLDVPPNATALAYGFFVSGTGQAWVSGATMEEVGKDVPTTNMLSAGSQGLPKNPVNLSFD